MRALTIALCLLATPALADVAGVATVIDGDTIEVHGQRIRLHGIDAPESRQLCRLDGKPWQCEWSRARVSHRQISPIKSGPRPIVTAQDRIRGRMPTVLALSAIERSHLGNPGLI